MHLPRPLTYKPVSYINLYIAPVVYLMAQKSRNRIEDFSRYELPFAKDSEHHFPFEMIRSRTYKKE